MQPKYTHNKSNIIKITEEAKRKSRQRLIGSIILLGIALFVLLNVTAKVKPITINPDVVEIKNKAASAINATTLMVKNNASAPSINNESKIAVPAESQNQITTIAASAPAMAKSSASQTGFKAGVVNKNTNQATTVITTPTEQSVKVTSSLPVKKAKPKPKPANPEDILNGLIDDADANPAPQPQAKKSKNYIQFAALKSQDKADELQQILLSHGINAKVQQIQTDNGTLYRLRAGPFNRQDAEQKLQQISSEGYNGIVTGN